MSTGILGIPGLNDLDLGFSLWKERRNMAYFPNRPNMKKMYDGRNTATRPIPVSMDSGTERAIAVASSEQRPKHGVVNMPSAPRVAGADAVFGTRVAGSASIPAGIHSPASNEGAL